MCGVGGRRAVEPGKQSRNTRDMHARTRWALGVVCLCNASGNPEKVVMSTMAVHMAQGLHHAKYPTSILGRSHDPPAHIDFLCLSCTGHVRRK